MKPNPLQEKDSNVQLPKEKSKNETHSNNRNVLFLRSVLGLGGATNTHRPDRRQHVRQESRRNGRDGKEY